MAILRYDLASAAVYDPIAMNRNATRNVLYAMGFRDIESFATLEDLRRAAANRDFDLLVLEAPKPDDPVYDFVHRTRRGGTMRNPFSVIVITTWIPENQLVRNVLDCGADDLICRPFSVAQLAERVRTHALARKNFVVTSDYVGPDRRKDPGRASSIKMIEVVNSLRMKAVEAMDGQAVQDATEQGVQKGRQIVNAERMRRLAFQIGVVAGFVSTQIESLLEGGVRRSDLEKVISVAREFNALADIEGADQCRRTGDTVIELAQKCLDGNEMARNAKLLVRLSIALQVMLSPGLNENDCQAELEETLERIRSRGRRS